MAQYANIDTPFQITEKENLFLEVFNKIINISSLSIYIYSIIHLCGESQLPFHHKRYTNVGPLLNVAFQNKTHKGRENILQGV